MTQQLRILEELGQELDRVGQQMLGRDRARARLPRAIAAATIAVASAAALAVAAFAVLALGGHSHHAAAGSGAAGARGAIVDRDGGVLADSVKLGHGYVRRYPRDDLAAQVLGTVGRIDPQEVGEPKYRGVLHNAVVGQSGLEAYYDSYLRSGDTLKLSLDARLEQVGQQALQHAIGANPPADGGAFVAIDPQDGGVYAIGSLPSYNANIFGGKPIPSSVFAQLNNPSSDYPFLNRAIQSVGPTGSAFEPLTALAALQSGAWTVGETYDDTGQFCIDGECRHNSGEAVGGVLDLVDAIRVSDGVFFYNLGALSNSAAPQGGALQQWARAFGIGRPTGIDLPSEDTGNLPTPAWVARQNELETECENATGAFEGRPKHPASSGGCGLAIVPEQSWAVGDNINLAVGQGDLQVSPLQLAVAYSAIANGGTIVMPHLGMEIESPAGAVLQKLDPPPKRRLNIDPLYLDAVREGMRAAASQPGGTSADVFGNFPEQVEGETGTAQYITKQGVEQGYAWYAGFVPPSATSKPIVVVVWVQQGGFGAHAAAPVARQILSQWFLGRPGPWVPGSSRAL